MRKKKFNIDRTPERVELMKLMASEDRNVAYKAQLAFAAFLRPIVQRLLDQRDTTSAIFRQEVLAKGAPQTIPIDPYIGAAENDWLVWSTTKAGGLHTQTVEGLTEYPFIYSNLDSALYLNKDYVEQSRLDLMAKAINRLVQEFVAKRERLGWTAILTALAAGTSTNGQNHVINSTTAGRLQIDDFNRLKTLVTRLYISFAGGSISGDYGLTDMYMSPERMADIRALSYQPVNTLATPNTDESTVLGLPDRIREDIFRAAGTSTLWDVTLHELRELGTGRKLNQIFDTLSTDVPAYANATQDLVIGMDLSQDTCISPVQGDNAGGTLVTKVDDQFYASRMDKVGWTFSQKISYNVIDNRWIVGLIV